MAQEQNNGKTRKIFLTPNEVAKILSVGKDKAYALCALDGFPAIKLGSAYRIDPEKFDQWLNDHLGECVYL